MPNAYAPGLSPAVGNGLPGMPVRKNMNGGKVVYDFLFFGNNETKTFTIPPGFEYFRVIGLGTSGSSSNSSSTGYYPGGGGGSACSFTKTLRASPGKVISGSLLATRALNITFDEYNILLPEAGGSSSNSSGSYGGTGVVGTGGDFNYRGGNGSGTFGGGSASIYGDGIAATDQVPGKSLDPYSEEGSASYNNRISMGAGAIRSTVTGATLLGSPARMRIELW